MPRTGTAGYRPPPAERVRARLAAEAGAAAARAMPSGYQRVGCVLLLRLPPTLRPHFRAIGRAWQEELGVATVLVRTGPIDGELRTPAVERVAGDTTETEVVEHGIHWRFDAARLMFAAGNRTERRRAGELVRPGETVVDLFAGIGYFAIPAARSGRAARVVAVEKNPLAYGYLTENAERNGVADRLTPVLGDNRSVALPLATADRIFLGYLPSAIPWIPRAVRLARPGTWLHVHLVDEVRGAPGGAIGEVVRAIDAVGAEVDGTPHARVVKPYGPGRAHVVVDVRLAATPTVTPPR